VSLQEFGLGDDAVYVFTSGIVGSLWARPESWDGTIQQGVWRSPRLALSFRIKGRRDRNVAS
jgi:hypothetical protein